MKFIEGCVANLATNRLGFTKVEAFNFIAIAFHHFLAVTKLENSCVRLLFFYHLNNLKQLLAIDNSLIFQQLYVVQCKFAVLYAFI